MTAQQRGIDLSTVAGTGPSGRIIQADVLSAKPGALLLPLFIKLNFY